MISDFIMEEGEGRLFLPENLRSSTDTKEDWETRRKIEPGKNGQEYWNLEQLCQQLRIALKVFDKLHPDKQALFVFDNSSAHGGFDDQHSQASDQP